MKKCHLVSGLIAFFWIFQSSVCAAQWRQPDAQWLYKTVNATELKLHVYTPEGHHTSDKRPAVIFFFGGGWNNGSPGQHYSQCAHLASRGMVAMSAEYRVKSRNQTTPKECVEDGKSAIRWVRAHAAELGIDPNRIAAGGASAGGHVAAAAGTVNSFDATSEDLSVSSRPDALVLFNPVFDNGPGGFGHFSVKAYWQDISPIHNISESAPPTIVFLGTKDEYIGAEVAVRYKELMDQSGVRCDLHLYPGQAHGFFNPDRKNGYFEKTLETMDDFLTSLDFLDPKSGE
ncbi:alpha/beta hydrolase [Opitutales bacterium]|nr:alpha/beta hydrolase [Opitutales bacterium]